MAYILNQKYTDAIPLYRQEQEFKRYGVRLTRQTLSDWTLKGAKLLEPLHKALKEELFANNLLHADETHPVIIYDNQIGRSGEYVKNFLKDGRIQLSNNLAE